MLNKYDAIIIGAGMSGLAAGIRLAMFDQKVLLIEKHSIAGGLNSYYQRRNKEHGGVRKFDVGLHALTNFAKKGERRKPFTKLLKQLRFSYDEFNLHEQSYSLIDFPNKKIKFNNDFDLFVNEISEKFPTNIDEFNKLLSHINEFNELDLNQSYSSSRKVLSTFISSELLVEMIICPLLIYGSAWEDDMDFAQFVIMFKSIYMEGFSRPEGGVRTIIDKLLDKFKSTGGELHFKESVDQIIIENDKVCGLITNKNTYTTNNIFSSVGFPETINLTAVKNSHNKYQDFSLKVGKLSFMETIIITDKKNRDFDPTIIFHNNSDKYNYKQSSELFDPNSAVFCCPDNYDLMNTVGEGTYRITFMANYDKWKALSKENYKEQKEIVFDTSMQLLKNLVPSFREQVNFYDVFSPTTVERYTSHIDGTVYGSTTKTRDGKTPFKGLYIIGTDQGFLGIVGSMLSGISMANLHGLMESR